MRSVAVDAGTADMDSGHYLNLCKTRMWANAQCDGRPAEYRWRPLFNAAKLGWPPVNDVAAVTKPTRETR